MIRSYGFSIIFLTLVSVNIYMRIFLTLTLVIFRNPKGTIFLTLAPVNKYVKFKFKKKKIIFLRTGSNLIIQVGLDPANLTRLLAQASNGYPTVACVNNSRMCNSNNVIKLLQAIRRTYPSTAIARGEEGDGRALLTVDGPACYSRWRQHWWREGGFPNVALMEDKRSTVKLACAICCCCTTILVLLQVLDRKEG